MSRGLLDDDHEERRQNAEAGDGDDQEQQDVEQRRFHLHGGEQRALHVAPGLNAIGELLGRKVGSQLVANGVQIGAGLQLELDRRDGIDAGLRIDHAPHLLQPRSGMKAKPLSYSLILLS